VEYACAANLVIVREIDRARFNARDARIDGILEKLNFGHLKAKNFTADDALPHEFPASVFWWAFLSKQRDRTSVTSTLNQFVHMLNPIFFADVVRIVWRRTIKGGVYEQN